MEIIISIFNQALYRPLFNALILIYKGLPFEDMGLAIIVLTSLIRLALYPLSQKAIKSQKAISQLQPEIKKIQKQYSDKEERAKAMMALYHKYKINPLSGCLPILIQLPILLALFQVFRTGLSPESFNGLYHFVRAPASLNLMFLGMIDLSQRSVFLAVLAGFFQFIQSKMMVAQKPTGQSQNFKGAGLDFSSLMSQQMTYLMPIVTVFISLSFPAALPLYWIVITLFGIIQQHFTKTELAS